jgi:endoglucanase Acf2
LRHLIRSGKNQNRLPSAAIVLAAVVLAAGCGHGAADVNALLAKADGPAVTIGEGKVFTTLEGTVYQPPQPLVYKTDRVKGPVPTNDWWSSLAWMPFSGAIYPHPLAFRINPDGVNVAYPDVRTTSAGFHALYRHDERDLTVGGRHFTADAGLLDGFGDWHVDMLLPAKDGGGAIRATAAHGSPYLYFTFEGVEPEITLNGDATFSDTGRPHEAVFEINGNAYALFAPTGTAWEKNGAVLRAALPEKRRYVSLALLPDVRPETVDLFRKYAYSFITGTKTSWTYDERTSRVETAFRFETKAMEGRRKGTLAALYPHQWKHARDAAFLPYEYRSPRGAMKLVEGSEFRTELVYPGMLPYLPTVGVDLDRLRQYLAGEQARVLPSPEGEGTYWFGKNYNRLANLIPLARAAGEEELRRSLAAAIREDMEKTLKNLEPHRIVYYDRTWGTVNLYPTQFGADTVLNDHHFHYGYWVFAAAVLALEDPDWAGPGRMGRMIEALIRDYANWERDGTQAFPFLRTFDPYAGHSWASGNATDVFSYSPGNNQESSSEALMASAALILWGEAVGNQDIRDAGIFMYATEVEAVRQYWLDAEHEHFPEEYVQDYAPIVLSAGGEFRTWWTNNPEEIYGINVLPVLGSSLYWGRDPETARRFYEDMEALNGGPPREWRDILWMLKALYDADGAMADFETSYTVPEYGESRSHTYHWIASLRALGRVAPDVIADTPLYAAFEKDGVRTYVAFNGKKKPIRVTFREADSLKTVHILEVPPGQLAFESVPAGG